MAYALVAHPRIGNWQQITRDLGADYTSRAELYSVIDSSQWEVGKVTEFSADVDTDANMNNCGVGLLLRAYGAGSTLLATATAAQINTRSYFYGALSDVRMRGSLMIPENTTSVNIHFIIPGSQAAVGRIGNVVVRKVLV